MAKIKKLPAEPTERDLLAEERLEEIVRETDVRDYQLAPSVEHVRTLVIEAAKAFVGVGEIGTSNSGYWVDKFLNALRLPTGLAWCMALVQAVIKFACDTLGIPDILPHNVAGVKTVWRWALGRSLVVVLAHEVRVGDLVCWSDEIGRAHV